MVNTKTVIALCFSVFWLCSIELLAQKNGDFYLFVEFTKKTESHLTQNPSYFLSEKALARRNKSHINITEEDVPISSKRINQITDLQSIKFNYALKWQNGVVVSTPDLSVKNDLTKLDFVASVTVIKKPQKASRTSFLKPVTLNDYNYGLAKDQNEIINIPFLHDFGYNGEDITLAIFDNGFRGLDTLPLFRRLWMENQILGQFDIVEGDKNAIPHGSHGTAVLSTIGAFSLDTMVGSAPEAEFYLFRTEDNASETLLEEYNWAKAAEIADSLGVDIINSSLGYSLFDDSTTSHTYADLDGKSTVVTKAANAAYRKGILVVNSAGNSGQRPWRYIIAPADGRYVLAVGATDSTGTIADFSSRGPNSAGLLKPNVSAVGARVVVADGVGGAQKSNGTSFSAPTIAGAAACLLQAFPEASNADIFRTIEASCDRYDFPDFDYGNGIPDFQKAYNLLSEKYVPREYDQELIRDFKMYPNPTKDFLAVELLELEETKISVKVFNYSGHELISESVGNQKGEVFISVNTTNLSSGYYVLELTRGIHTKRRVFIKH